MNVDTENKNTPNKTKSKANEKTKEKTTEKTAALKNDMTHTIARTHSSLSHNIKVSVIIPVYNVEPYLEACIASARAQTFRDIEIILIDDASPDNSRSIIATHLAQDDRIVHITHQKNAGSGAARNTGIAASRGEYIYFLDSDDFLHKDAIAVLYHAIKINRVDIVIGGFIPIKDQHYTIAQILQLTPQKIHDKHYTYKRTVLLTESQDILSRFGEMISRGGILAPSWNKLYRKQLFTENNISYLAGVHTEDLATTPKILLHARNVLLHKKPLYYYRLRDNSATSIHHISIEHQTKLIEDHIASIESVKNYFIAQNQFIKHYAMLQKMFQTNLFQVVKNENCSAEVQRASLSLFFAACSKEIQSPYPLIDAHWYTHGVFHLLEFPQLTETQVHRWIWCASLPTYKKPYYLLKYFVKWLLRKS